MSRFVGSLALVVVLSSLTATGASAQHFAEPPSHNGANAQTHAVDRAEVRAKLAATRAVNIAAFVAYERGRVYPSNTTVDGPANIWRDANGHLCAAATIIDRSGAHDLVKHVGDTDNNLRLATVHDGPVMTWMLESGLTQEELALIQRPFRPVVQRPQPEPQPVDTAMRTKETARLAALYQQIEKDLASEEQTALDTATDRLMAHPELAADVAQR